MNEKKQCIVLLVTILYTFLANSQLLRCSSPILSNLLKDGSAYTTILSENSRILSSLPLIGQTNNAWAFTNNSKSIKIALKNLSHKNQLGYYLTAIGIRTAADTSATCQNETALDLTEFDVRYRYAGTEGDVGIRRRVYTVPGAEREIRIRFPEQFADKIEITRRGEYTTSAAVYCLQFELYGCPAPSVQREVLSYEYTQSNLLIFFHLTRFFLLPNFYPTDPVYLETGICDGAYLYCSGGIGILMDGIIGTSSIDVITNSHSIGFHCPNVADYLQVCRKHFSITLTQLFHVDTIVVHGYVGSYFGDVILAPKVSLTNGPSNPNTKQNKTGNMYALEVEINSTTRYIDFDIALDRNSITLMTEIEVISQGLNLALLLTKYTPHSVRTICPTTSTTAPCTCEKQTIPPDTTTIPVNSTTLANSLTTSDSHKTLLILIIVLLVILMVQATVNLASSLYGNIVSRYLQKKMVTKSLNMTDNQIQNNSENDKLVDACDNKNRTNGYQPSPPSRPRVVFDNGKSVSCEDRIYNPLYTLTQTQEYESVEYSTVCENNNSTKTNPFIHRETQSIDLDDYNKLEQMGGRVGRTSKDTNPDEKEITPYSNVN